MPLIQTDSQHYSDIADAIRDMSGNEETFYPSEMAAGVRSIPQTIAIQPIIYSLEEREVGVWTDGKPLYQKTFYVTFTIPSTARVNTDIIDLTSLNIDNFIGATGFWIDGSIIKILNYEDNYPMSIRYNKTTKYLQVLTINFTSEVRNVTITLQYTKTTDTPGSGTWTPSGVPAHHYSATEQVIGTWIDGKPIYEKSFNTNFTSGSASLSIPFTGCNIRTLVDLKGWVDNSIYFDIHGSCGGRGVTVASNHTYGQYGYILDDGITINRYNAETYPTTADVKVTIQYTKTTD